jgi:hypothetical protein
MNTAIPVLIVAILAALLSFQAAKSAAREGSRFKGLCLAAIVGLVAWGILAQGLQDEWPSAVGWVAFLAGAIEALATPKDEPPWEVIAMGDPNAPHKAKLLCSSCRVEAITERTTPPPLCPKCGKPLQG